jgi:histidyl-tRNA synthetase
MLATLLDELGHPRLALELNSVGSAEDRVRYNAALREALAPVKHQLCEDNQRRADTNPLRVLDSKDEADQDLINALPKIADYLDPDSSPTSTRSRRARRLRRPLPPQPAPRPRPRLLHPHHLRVHRTQTTGLGTQNALLGGGRYDGLSEMLGGPKAPGIGFAIGEDRLILTLQAQAAPKNSAEAGLRVEVGDGFPPEEILRGRRQTGPPHGDPRRRRGLHQHLHRQDFASR